MPAHETVERAADDVADSNEEPSQPPAVGTHGTRLRFWPGNIRGNIQIVRYVRIVRESGPFGRSGVIRTDMTPE
jgi:hypothetical protein